MGKYDNIVTTVCRDIVNSIHQGDRLINESYVLPNKLVEFNGDMYDVLMDFSVDVTYDCDMEMDYDISAHITYYNPEDIDIRIKIQIRESPFKLFTELIPDLKDTIRHEIEHILQYLGMRGEMHFGFTGKETAREYFLLEQEIPAFVFGLYKNAKTRRIPMDMMFDIFFEQYKEIINGEDALRVRGKWEEYARMKLPNAKWGNRDGRQ